jgi:hypothetical protein
MLALLLAVLPQDRPEAAGDLQLVRPAGWTRQDDAAQKSVQFAPPGVPPGKMCTVTVTAAEPVAGTAAEWHTATFGTLSGANTLVRGAKAEAAGPFTRSWGEFRRAAGGTVWITLYTAAAEGQGRAILYVATDPDLYLRHAGAVDAMARGAALPGQAASAAAAAPAVADESVIVPAPDNWTTQPGEKGAIVYVPPNLRPGQACSFVLLPSEAATADAVAYHAAGVKAATAGLKSVKVLKTDDWGEFKGSDLEIETAEGGKGKAAVYTVRWAGRGQMGIYACNDAAVHGWTAGWIPQVLIKAYVPNPLLAPGAACVPIVDVFFKAELEMGVTVDLRAGTTPQLTKKFLVLFKNGLALRVDAMSSGLLDGTYVAQGLASLDAEVLLKARASDRRTGKWREQDGAIVVNWTTGSTPETYRRNGVRLEGPKTWSRFTLADAVKIEGTFTSKNLFGLPPWSIRLTKAGRFEADGVNHTMGGNISSPTFPEKGGGTYEIRTGTIILRFDNGYRTSIALQLGGDEPAAPTSVILNGTAFDRS